MEYIPLIRKNKLCSAALVLAVGFAVGLPVLIHAQRSKAGSLPGIVDMARIVTGQSLPAITDEAVSGGIIFTDFPAIQAFYDARSNLPLWTGEQDRVNGLIAVLRGSWRDGLNPEDYHLAAIDKILSAPPPDRTGMARLELLLTDAALRYGRHMTGMRVAPVAIGQKSKYWRQPMMATEVLGLLDAAADPVRAVAELAPRTKLYSALRDEMVRLHELQAAGRIDAPITLGGGLFRPGQSHEDVAALRATLGLPYDVAAGPETFYDDGLAAAVMAFQRRHNLKADGIIGPKTLELVNRTTADRIAQVAANMERLRWMDPAPPARYIIVNIPSQMLWAVENGEVVEEMPVVVGMPTRPTQSFRTDITGVRFNPNWTVPLSIKMADMLPKLQDDPYALSDRGIDIIQGRGRDAVTVDPGAIDWYNITRAEMNRFRMVQTPGAHNALGNIRVLMPNDYDIYLHDTNHRELFGQDERFLSSGCIRLSQPDKIARFIMAEQEGWSDEKMQRLLARGLTTDVPIAKTLPVFIVYQTMWFGAEGDLVYGPDVYDQDKRLMRALRSHRIGDPAKEAAQSAGINSAAPAL